MNNFTGVTNQAGHPSSIQKQRPNCKWPIESLRAQISRKPLPTDPPFCRTRNGTGTFDMTNNDLKMEALTLQSILEAFNAPINEEQAWAVCFQCAKFLNNGGARTEPGGWSSNGDAVGLVLRPFGGATIARDGSESPYSLPPPPDPPRLNGFVSTASVSRGGAVVNGGGRTPTSPVVSSRCVRIGLDGNVAAITDISVSGKFYFYIITVIGIIVHIGMVGRECLPYRYSAASVPN